MIRSTARPASRVFRRAPIALAILTACAGLGAIPLHAQAQTAQAIRHYDIPAGPLDQALNRFAAEAGILLTIDASLTAGKQSPGLKGDTNAAAGLQKLLQGTGLEAVKGDNGWQLRRVPMPLAEESTLAPMTVTAAGLGTSTEKTRSYTTGAMSTATRLPLSIRETPQSVTVITRQRMDDQATTSLTEVLQYTPGLTVNNADGPGRTSFSARGFNIDNVMYDGMPSRYESWVVGTVANMSMYDRAEIVRGATGLVTGAGNPSAAINLVRKRPTKNRQASITGRAGSWDNFQGEVDVSGAINEAGSLRARAVGSYQDANTFRDGEAYKHGLFYAIAEADLGERTMLSLGASYQDDYTNHFWGGLPISTTGQHMNLPRSTNPSNDWERKDQQLLTVFGDLRHRFENGWQTRFAFSHSEQDAVFMGTYIRRSPLITGLGHSAWRADYEEKQSNYDLTLEGPFQFLGRTHELSFGGGQRISDKTTQNYSGSGIISSNIDLTNWDRGSVPEPNFVKTTRSRNVVTQDGIYGAARFNLADPLKLIIGARLDWYDYDNRSGTGDYSVTRNLTRYGGLIYDLDERHSLFASYTDIFQPQSSKDVQQKNIAPIVGENYEVGVKGEYFAGLLNASASIFRIDQKNRAKILSDQTACPTYPAESCYEAAGLVRSEGVDLEIQGALTPNWQLAAGYSYVDIKYVKDANPANEGKRFDTNTPRQQFKLSTLYRLSGPLQAWRVGGSLYYQDKIYRDGTLSSGSNFRIQQEAYALLDVLIGYRIDRHMDLQLNVNNIFDKVYYKGLGYDPNWGSTDTYGSPRNFMLTAKYTF